MEKRKPAKNGNGKSRRRSSLDRRMQLLAVLLLVISFMLLLSILMYSPADEVSTEMTFGELLRIPFDSESRSAIGSVQNPLGIIGALVANALIVGTFGYAVIAGPILLGVWSWVMLRKIRPAKVLTFTNYLLVITVLFSLMMGVASIVVEGVPKEWSGMAGRFLADVMTKLLGNAGASIIVLTVFFITIVFAVDLDVHKTLDRLQEFFKAAFAGKPKNKPRAVVQNDQDKDFYDDQQGEQEETRINRAHELHIENAAGIEPEPEEPPIDEEEPEKEEDIPLTPPPPLKVRKPTPPAPSRPPPASQTVIEEQEIDYVMPSIDLLDPVRHTDQVDDEELKSNADLLRNKLANFGVAIENVTVTPGPVVTLYELVPASDVKISRIVSLSDDLALALAAKGIRILAPIPGKSAVGVEIPNHNPSIVSIRSIINTAKFRDSKAAIPLALGKTISGDVYIDDLAKMPHLLIAGATGSGKSVGINTILTSILYKLHPTEVKLVVIDPKKIELTLYKKLRNHFLATTPDVNEEIITTPEGAVAVLKSVELEMEKRYDRLAAAGVRNIQDYNERIKSGRLKDTETIKHRKMPYLVVVIDELADLMLTAAREVEEPIARLAQLARAIGVHLVLATQRPSVDVITGVIKANFPARMAYQVASKVDSRTILDMNGAEQLLGNGDMLYLPAGSSKPVRMQNAFISTDEVERITDHIERQQGYANPMMLPSIIERKRGGLGAASGDVDDLFEEAARLVVRHQQGSVSLVQRRLKVGYSRAARLIDELEAAGIVGPFDGSKAREVLVESEADLENILRGIV